MIFTWKTRHTVTVTHRIHFTTLSYYSVASIILTLSWLRPLSYRNQSIDLRDKSTDWFLYDNGHRHERVNFDCHCNNITSFNIWTWISLIDNYYRFIVPCLLLPCQGFQMSTGLILIINTVIAWRSENTLPYWLVIL